VSRYRKIDVRMWNDAKFRSLSAPQPNARDLWVYLLTNPYTTSIPGLYHAFPETLARGLEWLPKPLGERFAELSRNGMAKADWTSGLVFIPRAIRYDPPANPNVVKGWASAWDELPECALKTEAYSFLLNELEPLGERFAEAFRNGCGNGLPNGLPNGMPNQEQEQEQEQEQDKDAPRGGDRFDFEAIYEASPGKKAKAKGIEALRKHVTTQATYDLALAAAKRYGDEERAFEASGSKEFRAAVPNFSTWCNQRRWEDTAEGGLFATTNGKSAAQLLAEESKRQRLAEFDGQP